MTKTIQLLLLALTLATLPSYASARAATVWINDWDSPEEQLNWAANVTVVEAGSEDYDPSRDLDGNGVYGGVGISDGRTVWGPHVIEAPPGCKFRNIVLTWVRAEGHKPMSSSYSMSLSYLGVFQGEQRTASTAGSTGYRPLRLDTSDIPEFQNIDRVTVRLTGSNFAAWKLGATGLYLTADIVRPGQADEPPKNEHLAREPRPHDGGRARSSAVLSWQPGTAEGDDVGYKVYLGTHPDQVQSATPSTQGIYMGRQADASFNTAIHDPNGLRVWKTYYWRVDQVDGTTVHKGSVWRFTVDPRDICTVWPDTDLAINGYTRIEPQIFSLTAYEGGTDFDPAINGSAGIDFCREYGVEGVGFVFPPGWMTPPNHFWSKMTMAEVRHWLEDPEGGAQGRFNHGPMPIVFGRVLPALRQAGVRPFMYAYGPEPGTSGCKEGDCAERWIYVSTRCIGMWLKAYPEFQYAHLWGEAAARWFRYDCGGHPCGPADYAAFFKRWARAVHERYPQLQLGGPVMWGHPTTAVGWEGWCKTLIDTAHEELDFLDWHAYGTPAVRLEGDLHASTAYAKVNYDKWLRHALTETNNAQNDLKRDEWYVRQTHFTKRVVPMAEQTFRFLRNPDKTFDRQIHDYSAWAGTYNVKFKGDERMPITPMMELFKIFKPLRGRRVRTDNPFDDVMLEAAVADNRLTIAIMNLSPQRRRVPLSIPALVENPISSVAAQILSVDALGEYEVSKMAHGSESAFDLPGQSIVVAVYETALPIVARQRYQRWEYFADDLMVQVNPNGRWQVSTTVRLNERVRRAATAATLRFGINRDDELAPPSWTIHVDGEPFVIERAISFDERRLPTVPAQNAVHITFTCNRAPLIDYAVSFASIVLTSDADYGPPEPAAAPPPPRQLIWSNDFGSVEQRKAWASFAHDDTANDVDGDGKGGFVQLLDAEDHVWGVERVDAPAGKTMRNLVVQWDVYRATANGADWQIALSPTGKFDGEQVIANAPPGLGRVQMVLDVHDHAGFENVSSVYLRLAGSNGPIAWSSKASAITLNGTLAPISTGD